MADIEMTVVTDIEGLDELEEALTNGSKRAAKRFLYQVERKAAKPLVTSAELNAPHESGILAGDIHTQTVPGDHQLTIRVGPRQDAFWGLFQEVGAPEVNVPALHWLENSAKQAQGEVLERYNEAVALGLEEMKK